MAGSRVSFAGGDVGPWRVLEQRAVRGDPLPAVERVTVATRGDAPPANGRAPAWSLDGVVSHLRYATRRDVDSLRPTELPLSRPEATRAVLIPIRKSAAWWALAQDERDEIFAARSRHSAIGLAYAGEIARKLYHSRDLGEPFDFLTWFEFEPSQATRFDELLAALRCTPEWGYVEREVEIHLLRDDAFGIAR